MNKQQAQWSISLEKQALLREERRFPFPGKSGENKHKSDSSLNVSVSDNSKKNIIQRQRFYDQELVIKDKVGCL